MSSEPLNPPGPEASPPPAPAAGQTLSSQVGRVRHDLRSPLTDILGFSEMLEEEAQEHGHVQLLPELQQLHQLAADILRQVNQTLDPQHLKANPGAPEELRQTIVALADQIIGATDSLSRKCAQLASDPFGEDLLRITVSTRKLTELAAGLPALMTELALGRAERQAAPRAVPGRETGDTAYLGDTGWEVRTKEPGVGPAAATGALLVVEDNETNRLLLTRRLRRQGYTVWVAENGRQALDLLRARQFDLVLLDIMMPEMDGYQVLDRIKSDPALRHLPVIMISGLDELDILVQCIRRGAEDYLTKPFDPVLLGARIGACLEKKRLRDQEQVHLRQLELYLQQLQAEQEKSERLLLNILPAPIAQRIKQGEQTIADSFQDVTVVFADLVGSTSLALAVAAHEFVQILNEVFSLFDGLADKHGLEKIKTIGDSYMAVGGLSLPRADHAEAAAGFALDIQSELAQFKGTVPLQLRMRVGLHSGPVIAGVIGRSKFIYDLWGDTVNTASRMESLSPPGCIQVSQACHQRLQDRFEFQDRGLIEVKGKGLMTAYYLVGRK